MHQNAIDPKAISCLQGRRKKFERTVSFGKFYIPARYPDDTFLEFKKEDAAFALEITEKLLTICDTARL